MAGRSQVSTTGRGSGRAPLRLTLRIAFDEVTLLGRAAEQFRHRPRGLDLAVERTLAELNHAQRGEPVRAERLQGALLDAGAELGRAFLTGDAGAALHAAMAQVEGLDQPLELALEIVDGRLADLPWETLRSPSASEGFAEPLVLRPDVRLYRTAPAAEPTLPIRLRGPLRVLVAIASPEIDALRLDAEAELATILDMVEPARDGGGAYVRILERGTVAAIRDAPRAEPFHVLHLYCLVGPGGLMLEDEKRQVDLVDVARLVRDVLPAHQGVPLIVLAGCGAALAERPQPKQRTFGEAAVPGLARDLLARGLPAVLAMTAPPTGASAPLLAETYRRLATSARPDPLVALSDARRQVEAGRRQQAGRETGALPVWATPALYQKGPGLPLYDTRDGLDEVGPVAEPALRPAVAMRGVGEFVGRHREQRQLLRALRSEWAGATIHGLGGVGKSTLAAQLVSDLADETALAVSVTGEVGVEQVLQEVGQGLLAYCTARQLDESHDYRQLSHVVRDPGIEWRERQQYLSQVLLPMERMLLVLDDFDDNLVAAEQSWRVKDPELANLLASWLISSGRSRVIVTTRYPFQLPDGRERRLQFHHLGPLSLPATRMLIRGLSGLRKLGREQQRRAYADVGGHPLTLEYLDAVLRGGAVRFDDVVERVEKAQRARGVAEPAAWMTAAGDLHATLAEAVTLTADGELLHELLQRVDPIEGARRLLLGASVYRQPVDEIGLRWQTGEEPAKPGPAPERFTDALAALEELGMVTSTQQGERAERSWAVHRWLASALAEMSEASELRPASRPLLADRHRPRPRAARPGAAGGRRPSPSARPARPAARRRCGPAAAAWRNGRPRWRGPAAERRRDEVIEASRTWIAGRPGRELQDGQLQARFLIRDRDAKFTTGFDEVFRERGCRSHPFALPGPRGEFIRRKICGHSTPRVP